MPAAEDPIGERIDRVSRVDHVLGQPGGHDHGPAERRRPGAAATRLRRTLDQRDQLRTGSPPRSGPGTCRPSRRRPACRAAPQSRHEPGLDAVRCPGRTSRPDQRGVVVAERPFDVGDRRPGGRSRGSSGRRPPRTRPRGASRRLRRRGDHHGRRRGEERHQELAGQCTPPPVVEHLHAQQVEHLHAERHARVNVVGQEGDPPGLVILLRALAGDTRWRRSRSPAASPPGP